MNMPRLLLVEDDASIQRFVTLALEDEPIEIVHASHLAAARAALQGPPFSIVMCDLKLPDGSGLDLLLSLAEPGAPSAAAARVVFSAGVGEPLRQQLLHAGVFRVLDKPVALAELMLCTRQALLSTAAAVAKPLPPVGTTPPAQPAAGQPASSAAAPAATDITSAVAHFFGGDFKLYVDFDQRCRVQFRSDLKLGEQALGDADLAALTGWPTV